MSDSRTCAACKWWEDFSAVCTNGLSPYCADFTAEDCRCSAWEPKPPETEATNAP